jgi:tetratricopeptide (TPR) repeat protein
VEKLLLFALLSWITGSPLLALLAILLLSGAGYGYLSGRLFRLPRAFDRWGMIRELQKAVATNPHDATARSDLGRLLVESGRHARALPHLEAAAARMPEEAETLYYLGAARLGTGDFDRGRSLIEQALARDPKVRYGEPHLVLARAYLARRDAARAIPHLVQLTAIHSSSVEGRYRLAQAYLATDQPERARAAVEDAVTVYRACPAFRRREERLWRWRAGWLRRRLGGQASVGS